MAVSTALPLMYCMMEKPALQDLSEALPGVTTGTGAPGSIVIHVEVCQNPCRQADLGVGVSDCI